MKNLPKINPSKALKASLPYLIAGLLCTKLGEAYRLTTGGDVIDRLLAAFTKLGLVFQNPFPSLHPFDLLVGAAAAVLLRLVVWSKIKNNLQLIWKIGKSKMAVFVKNEETISSAIHFSNKKTPVHPKRLYRSLWIKMVIVK